LDQELNAAMSALGLMPFSRVFGRGKTEVKKPLESATFDRFATPANFLGKSLTKTVCSSFLSNFLKNRKTS
jgi:hypothetical protein